MLSLDAHSSPSSLTSRCFPRICNSCWWNYSCPSLFHNEASSIYYQGLSIEMHLIWWKILLLALVYLVTLIFPTRFLPSWESHAHIKWLESRVLSQYLVYEWDLCPKSWDPLSGSRHVQHPNMVARKQLLDHHWETQSWRHKYADWERQWFCHIMKQISPKGEYWYPVCHVYTYRDDIETPDSGSGRKVVDILANLLTAGKTIWGLMNQPSP